MTIEINDDLEPHEALSVLRDLSEKTDNDDVESIGEILAKALFLVQAEEDIPDCIKKHAAEIASQWIDVCRQNDALAALIPEQSVLNQVADLKVREEVHPIPEKFPSSLNYWDPRLNQGLKNEI